MVWGFYGLCFYSEVWLWPAGSTTVLEVGIEGNSVFTSALQSLETHSSQTRTAFMCVCVPGLLPSTLLTVTSVFVESPLVGQRLLW